MRMKTPISPKGIFFDVDDTLYDHLAPFRDAVQKVARPDGTFHMKPLITGCVITATSCL